MFNSMQNKKIWLWVSLGMFLVPELLWSPVMNFIYEIFQNNNHVQALRPNFLTDSSNVTPFIIVVFIQFLGLLITTVIMTKSSAPKSAKISSIAFLLILLILTGFVLFTAYSLRNGIGF
jgi:hypothetical protein